GMSDADIEEYLGISERSMRRLRATYLATGEVVRIPVCPGRPRLLDSLDSHFIEGCILRQPNISLKEL
ncbi:hypothetical protein EDB85DRAFT_1810136, partial [Lactarius pseudohatsudake]